MPLLQEACDGDAWCVLVTSLCLKRTRRSQAQPVVDALLDRYPTPAALRRADRDDLEELLRPLGLWRTRTEELERVAGHLAEEGSPETREEVLGWHGVGKYVADSYAIFVLGDPSVEPDDGALRRHLE